MPEPELSIEEKQRLDALNRRFLVIWLTGAGVCLSLGYLFYVVRDAPAVRTLHDFFSGTYPRISGKYHFFLGFGEQAALFYVAGAVMFLPFVSYSFFSMRALRRTLDSRFGRIDGFGSNEVLNALIAVPLSVALFLVNFVDLNLVSGDERSRSSMGWLLFGSPLLPFISTFSFFAMAAALAGLSFTLEKVFLRRGQ